MSTTPRPTPVPDPEPTAPTDAPEAPQPAPPEVPARPVEAPQPTPTDPDVAARLDAARTARVQLAALVAAAQQRHAQAAVDLITLGERWGRNEAVLEALEHALNG